jgi:hypothetical protein
LSDIRDIVGQSLGANLSVKIDGPPNFDSGRVIVRGDAAGFRFLARVMDSMAEAVSKADHSASKNSWQIVLSPSDLSQLEMDNSKLVLDCDPQHRVSPLRG